MRIVDDRILQHDRCVIAAQLERHTGEAMRGHFHHFLTAAHGTREANLGDIGITNQGAHVGVRTRDDVEDSRWQLFGDALYDAGGGQRSGQRRLHDDGVAGQQRVGQSRPQNGDRPVERNDNRDYAERLIGHRRFHRNRAVNRRQYLRLVDLFRKAQRELPT